jgi:hypothetical protein
MGSTSKLAVLSVSLALTAGALPAWSSALYCEACEEGSYSWKVSVVPDRIAGVCDGGRGVVRVQGDKISYYAEGMSNPNWVVNLKSDGSAETAYGEYKHRQIRVKVTAGTGPREITTLNERWMCDFKFIPD